MPACFRLTERGEEKPSEFEEVDMKMRRHFGFFDQCETHYMLHWFRTVGLYLAMGKSMEWIRNSYREDAVHEYAVGEGDDSLQEYGVMMIAVVDWLEANYTIDSWYER